MVNDGEAVHLPGPLLHQTQRPCPGPGFPHGWGIILTDRNHNETRYSLRSLFILLLKILKCIFQVKVAIYSMGGGKGKAFSRGRKQLFNRPRTPFIAFHVSTCFDEDCRRPFHRGGKKVNAFFAFPSLFFAPYVCIFLSGIFYFFRLLFSPACLASSPFASWEFATERRAEKSPKRRGLFTYSTTSRKYHNGKLPCCFLR